MARTRPVRSVFLLSVLCAIGCAPTPPSAHRDAGGGHALDAAGAYHYDGGIPMLRDSGPFQECAAQSTQAEAGFQPVDVIWVIDRSGSMRGEADIVQDNINNFARDIDASGIDYHVVMISAMEFVRVPPPLGSDTERFLYVEQDVGSHDGLKAPLERFETYAPFLRPNAATHFVVVTDDESDLGARRFETEMSTRLGHSFTFHSIASPPGERHCEPPGFCFVNVDGCEGPNGTAADNGQEYWQLSGSTGGQRLSICTPDWSGLFSTLTSAIAVPVPLPCRYTLPDPPGGMELDRTRVNVVYTPSSGAGEQIIPNVSSIGGCNANPGWYYDGDDIVACPATCDTISQDTAGRVDIAFGCATLII